MTAKRIGRWFAAVALTILLAAPAVAQEKVECTCASGRACYHYLNAPVDPAEGPCACPACDPKRPHAGNKTPAGWNPQCFARRDMDCFLKRHAASWGMICSVCVTETDCCNSAQPDKCPRCQAGDHGSPFGKRAAERAGDQFAVERKQFKKRKPVVVWSRRFYVVTDIAKVQMRTQSKGLRWVTTHEYAHIMVERCERAYRDFSKGIGRARISRPVGVFLPAQGTVARKVKETYFRNPRAHMVYGAYGGAAESNIAGGFCLNGLCVSLQKVGGKDAALHQAVRHNLGHLFVSNWIKTQGENRTLPRWMYVGAGHWLGKLPESLRDEVFFCEGEARRVSGSGKDWRYHLTKRARTRGFRPIEELLAKSSLGQLTYRDHQRSWGYFQLALSEWRRPFVALLSDLRREKDVREAFGARLSLTPEAFHARFEARLREQLDHFDPGQARKKGPKAEVPRASGLPKESDPVRLAAAIRGLGPPADADTVRDLFAALAAHDDDLVRETVFQALLKSKPGPARDAIPALGLVHANSMARAYAARACRRLRLKGARDALRKALGDADWFVRSEAALATAAIRDYDGQAAIRKMVEGPAPKARIGAMDALRLFGEDVNPICVPVIARNLSHSDWQVRVACCQALADLGDARAVGPLVGRMQKEAGRVAEEIRIALRAITGDDLGLKPEHWKDWWEREEARVKQRGGFITRPKPKKDDEESRYAEEVPQYYGVKLFSARVGFILDTSGSTDRKFALDTARESRLHGQYENETVLGICQGEIINSLRTLDPRTRVSVVAFGTAVFRWKKGTVPLTAGHRNSAEGFVKSKHPAGETNFYGALASVLDLEKNGRHRSGFRDTPDTITFLTDGSPTVGDITDADTLLDWYTELNRYARMKTHVFAFGSLGVDEKLLAGMARRNGGRFVQIRELPPK